MGVSISSYFALLVRILLLAVNCTAIFFAFITYRSDKRAEWKFEVPTRVVVWAEFLGIGCLMLWMMWRFLLVIYAALKELDSRTDNLYKRNLQLCTAVRKWYQALMLLDFNLLLFLRFISPPAVAAALGKARRRVYGKYGTRVHHEGCCTDLFCCCCFYGRLVLCTLLQGSVVAVLAAAALLAVFIKVLQLRFLGDADIRNWSITELLLFGQFVVNMAWLDTRQADRRKAKLELLFHGADAEGSSEEKEAVKLVEDLALLMLRYHYSLFTALAVHHSIASEDISYLYIEDHKEVDKPRNQVRHERPGTKKGNDGSNNKGGSGSDVALAFDPLPPPPPPQIGRSTEWARHAAGNGVYADPAAATPGVMTSGQVVVEMSPRHRPSKYKPAVPPPPAAGAAGGGSGCSTCSSGEVGPSAPQLAGGPLERFPYDFYTYGRASGIPVRQSARSTDLKDRYEHNLYCKPGQ